ncbi:ExbD/TolR family protein [Mangrovicoccus algicola]|uniref:Biopolymer transporter ExbD n=1 Tax=Mangrovicoccus algicola TaxID=2771008 RepID=A0A8J6YWL9_9RHOB|nr:biopolymer transporter ExbD [Mangrovicoccus algicola]MBE3638962.1 biopolymer transporter ExbD [Mangrovicoccus algicola]
MRLAQPQKRQPAESIIPMINVVFLLLIFFLMTAQIAPPAPFEVDPPASESDARPEGEMVLHVDAEGRYGFREHAGGDEVLAALKAAMPPCPEPCAAPAPLQIRVDAGLPAPKLAALMAKLPEAGIRRAEIVTAVR